MIGGDHALAHPGGDDVAHAGEQVLGRGRRRRPEVLVLDRHLEEAAVGLERLEHLAHEPAQARLERKLAARADRREQPGPQRRAPGLEQAADQASRSVK